MLEALHISTVRRIDQLGTVSGLSLIAKLIASSKMAGLTPGLKQLLKTSRAERQNDLIRCLLVETVWLREDDASPDLMLPHGDLIEVALRLGATESVE